MASVWIKEEVDLDSGADVQGFGTPIRASVDVEVSVGDAEKASGETIPGKACGGELPSRPAISFRKSQCNPFCSTTYCQSPSLKSSLQFLRTVAAMRSLAEDYFHMSLNKNSEYCSKLHPAPVLVQCHDCGRPFVGRDRILALHQHIESWHHIRAKELTQHFMKMYKILLVTMKRHFLMDCHLIAHFHS